MSNLSNELDTCGCCEGIRALTPVMIHNQPGLSALVYRVGTHAAFKETMQAALTGQSPLLQLTTRDDDDPAIALCDAWAMVLDVLSFYEERIANEGYLRTAAERQSILEMARSIGYELRPGVAAGTYLAFSLETVDGAPTSAKIGVGAKAQSVPGQDELPQIFETVEEIEARGEWNELRPLSKKKEIPGFGAKELYLKGISTGLKPGDGLLMIGAEREADAGSERWDFRWIKEVTTDQNADFTRVTWNEGLGWQMFSNKVLPAEKDFQVFEFRKQASLFGHNAPDWRTMPTIVKDEFRILGLNAEYFNSINLTDLKHKRTDPKIDFDWGSGKPHPFISSDTFSVRWTGFVKPEKSGNYTFYTISDDGVRLWVNNEPIIDNWTDHGEKEDSGNIWLQAAKLYDIRLEYYERTGVAKIVLLWSGPGFTMEVISPSYLYPPGEYDDWPGGFNIAAISGNPDADPIKTIYLDALYPDIVEDSWLILDTAEPNLYTEVYKVDAALASSRKNFTLTSKTTAVTLDGENLREKFNNSVRETVVFAQSEELEIAEKPLTEPVKGHLITLDRQIPDLEEKRRIIVSGMRIRVRIPESTGSLVLTSTDGSQTVTLSPGETLVVMKAPEIHPGGKFAWTLRDKYGFEGTVTTGAEKIILAPARKEDEVVSEVNMIETVEPGSDPTAITLENDLKNSFDRSTVTIYANVAQATHGETKKEIVGSGDGSETFQKFELKQKPLTYLSASTPSGSKSSLELRVNNLLWEEVTSLDRQPPEKRAYISRIANDGTVTVQFGDGNNGARPPTGTENISANYRIGTGLGGMVKAEQISMLMTPVLGVKSVVNPIVPMGAADPEKLDNARRNAPLTVFTFDRIVSLKDYEDFAGAFGGIGKAQANTLWDGEQRLIHITVAGADGGKVPEDSQLYQDLIDAIDAARHPDHPVVVDSYESLTFDVKAGVHVDYRYIVEDVFASITTALLKMFSFENRSFGQAVTQSEVYATIQKVKGVVALDLDKLHFTSHNATLYPRLPQYMAEWEVALNSPAKLLTVNHQGITLTEMTL